MDKLDYSELMLGEALKERFLAGEKLNGEGPYFLNTQPFFANLHMTDAAIATVLGGLNLLAIGDAGTGKTQMVRDFSNHYFGGNKQEGGEGIWIRGHPELDIYNEIFTRLNLSKAKKEVTDNINAVLYAVDEFNRCPPVSQNQFLGLGDGVADHAGRSLALGREGFHILMATANLGNGEFQGTFASDKANYNRLHVAIDFDHPAYKPTKKDQILIDKLIAADPRVKEAKKRNIVDKIITAKKQIEEITKDPGLESLAVLNYLRFGLGNCLAYGSKGKVWPLNCQDCSHNVNGDAICSLVRAPVRRTTNAMLKYAAALNYLIKLKDPEEEVNAVQLMFKSFELTGTYQFLLNPQVLKTRYYDQNPQMMSDVVAELKTEFMKNQDYIMMSLEAMVTHGKKFTRFFNNGKGKIGIYDVLTPAQQARQTLINPYNDENLIGLSWVNEYLDIEEDLKQ